MGIIVQKPRGVVGLTKVAKFSIVVFIISFAAAMVDTVWALYLDGFFHNPSYVGFFSGFLTLVSFVSSFALVPFIAKHNKSRLYLIALMVYFMSYLFFSFNTSLILLVISGIVLTICYSMRLAVFGMLMRDVAANKRMNQNVGIIYSFLNVAWVLGPLVAGYVLATSKIGNVFALAALFIFAALLLFKFSRINDANINRSVDGHVIRNFLEFFKDKKRVISYLISGGVSFWWVLIYIYVPLMIERSGIGVKWIGYFLFAVAIPLILTEYFFSGLASKKGHKNIIFTGYTILWISALASFFFFDDLRIVLGILVLASFGGAMIEPVSESYFFTILKDKKEETRYLGPYNTTFDLNLFLGKVIPATLLLFLSYRSIFLVFTTAMIIVSIISLKAKE